MTDIVFVIRLLSLASFIFIFSACNASPTAQSTSDFDKLCNIYKIVVEEYKGTNDPLTKRHNIAIKIEKEIPNILEYFGHVSNAAREERYKLFKQIAEAKTKKPWDCPAMEIFYIGDHNIN